MMKNDEPWLFDLQEDPDEVTNFFGKPECRNVVRDLSKELLAYGAKYKDPYVESPRIKQALAEAAS